MNKKSFPILILLLMVVGFLGGSVIARKTAKNPEPEVKPASTQDPTPVPFVPEKKSEKPEVKFFVMSFCPFGNQAEAGLEPVYQLLKDKVDWKPQYILSEITQQTVDSCKAYCPQRVANENAKSQCQSAFDAGQLGGMSVDDCVKTYFPYKTADECIKKECATLKIGSFESLHGEQELNQDIREICAFGLGDVGKWWKFISLVNQNCNSGNADNCWKRYAEEAGLDAVKISQCERTQKVALAKKEIEETQKYNVSGSPTVFVNGTLYNGGRSPEDYKKAICAAFENPPEECNTVLGQESSAPASGGCN